MGEVFAGRYELVDLIDEGGMGMVWRAWDLRENAYRAAKVLKQSDSAALLRFVRETSWRIDHDHVVTPLGWAGEDDRVLFTMPLIRGGTVAMLIKDFGALPARWRLTLLDQLLQALDAVHRAGLVHRDVKPGNLLLDATGRDKPHLRLTDFGIAAAIDDPRLTRVGQVIGTPGYQAPEAAAGADPDPRQDLFAAGMVAVEMITGMRPQGRHPEIPDGLHDGVVGALLARLLAVHPADRPSSAAEARAELAAAQAWGDPGRDIEVFDHLPPLPAGWQPDGPATRVRPVPSLLPETSQPTGAHPQTPRPQTSQLQTQPAPQAGSAPELGTRPVTAAPEASVTPVPGDAVPTQRRRGLRALAVGLVAGGVVCVVAVLLLLL